MYCKYCGNELPSEAAFCAKCGTGVGGGSNFCPQCGQPVHSGSTSCPNCGTNIFNVNPQFAPEAKSKIAAALFAILLPCGIHSFYLGNVGKGVAQLLLAMCCGIGSIWCFIEGILILCGEINTDANGNPLRV